MSIEYEVEDGVNKFIFLIVFTVLFGWIYSEYKTVQKTNKNDQIWRMYEIYKKQKIQMINEPYKPLEGDFIV